MRALSIIAAAAAGAAATYFFDPEQGRRRRAVARDKVASGVHSAADASQALAQDLRHRSRGLVAAVRQRVAREPVSDDVLAERVRARIGRAVSHPGAIEVQVTQGVVTLQGPVLSAEAARLLRATRAVRGVQRVIDQLDSRAEAGNVPGLQG